MNIKQVITEAFKENLNETSEKPNKYIISKNKNGKYGVSQEIGVDHFWNHSEHRGYHDNVDSAKKWAVKHAGKYPHTIQVKESVEDINENTQYNDRLEKEVNAFIKQPTSVVEIGLIFDKYSKAVEKKLGTKRFAEYKKDAVALAKKKGLVKTVRKAKDPYQVEDRYGDNVGVTEKEANEVLNKWHDAVGNSFPDGDPHDSMSSFFRKKGWDERSGFDLLNKILKKSEKVKDSHAYLAMIWDDHYRNAKYDYETWEKNGSKGQAPHIYGMMGGNRAKNPWK